MRILALESSCDESAVAVYDDSAGLLAHEIYSQVDLHRIYGGVVPELASRDHVRRLLPLVRTALADAKTAPAQIDGVAYTAGPGLIGALLTGAALGAVAGLCLGCAGRCRASPGRPSAGAAARSRAAAVSAPGAAGVGRPHHAHRRGRRPAAMRCSGETRDDAAGEAFDKSAKLLGLPYPGGPELARLARAGQRGALRFSAPDARSRRTRIQFLRIEDGGFARGPQAGREPGGSTTRRAPTSRPACRRPSSTRSIGKTLRALEETGYDALVVAGGVGANRALRERLAKARGAPGRESLLPAHRVLHRQCRHDCGGGHGAAQGGRARNHGDPRTRALAVSENWGPYAELAHGANQGNAAVPRHTRCRARRRRPTRAIASSCTGSRWNASSVSSSGNGASSRPS